jgi:hypothetical protein
MNDAHDEKIERLLKGALDGLPLRRAPAALEQRVLRELAQRAASPWWRRNFGEWPVTARTAFVVLCVALAGLSLTSGLTQHLSAQTWLWAKPVIGLMASIGSVATLAVGLVPPLFLYAALIVGASLYTLLFALGACAYRTLYLPHSNPATIRS